jgi:hypothetical protein
MEIDMSNHEERIRIERTLRTGGQYVHLGIAEAVARERKAQEYGRRCAMTTMPNTVAWVEGSEYLLDNVDVTVHLKGGRTLQYAFGGDGEVYTQVMRV